MPQIHCLNNISPRGTDQLPESYTLTDDFSQADGVLVRSASLHDAEFPPSLLAIGRAGAGVNNIPLDRCAEEGIVVFNAPGANANAVKEIVICSLLLGSRGIVEGIDWVRANADDPAIAKSVEKAKKAFAGREIAGKKLGVIGLGAIGALVANAAIDLGMEVYGYDPYVSVAAAWRISSKAHLVTDLDELCRACDYLTIHVPALDSTRNMIGARQIELMKDDAVLLNFSRETIVDLEALVSALEAGTLGRYITDFAHPVTVKAKGVITVPHLGASTAEAEDNCAVMAVKELVDFLENGAIVNSVNFPACSRGPRPADGARISVLHRSVEGLPARLAAAAEESLVGFDSAERGAFGCTLMDLAAAPATELLEALESLEGVIRVRVLG